MEPYRLLFPIGVLAAAVGAALWIAFAIGGGAYPGLTHANLMSGGFLLLFAAGFLGTAVPRLTATRPFGLPESRIALSISVAMLASSFASDPVWYTVSTLVALLLLVASIGRRFRQNRRHPPAAFPIAAGGMLCGILGNFAILGARVEVLPNAAASWGRLAFHHGMMLGMILGIGALLVTVLLGWGELPPGLAPGDDRAHTPARAKSAGRWLLLGAAGGAALPASFAFDATGHAFVGGGIRAVLATVVALRFWRIHRLPRRRTALSFGTWAAAWCLLAGLYGYALVPGLAVHLAHLGLIGGFGLMTLMVATRVTLAHGGYTLAAERRAPFLIATIVLVLLAAFTRATAPLTWSYERHLAFAASAWILALGIWSAALLPKIWRSADQPPNGA